MSQAEQIRVLCAKLNISVSELARQYGASPQNFGQKAKRGGFTPAELNRIAASVGCSYDSSFVLPDGDRVPEKFAPIPSETIRKEGLKFKMLSDSDIERRCRYRLKENGLRMHKAPGDRGPVYFVYEEGGDDTFPDDDSPRWMDLQGVLAYCEELAEKDAERREEQRAQGK